MSSEDQYSSARTRSQNPDPRPRIALAFGLAAAIVVIQFVGSLMTGSLALLTDTAHALTDASGLLVALIAATLALKPATAQRTWGFRRIEVLAALAQATLLMAVGLYAAFEGIHRLFEPPEVPASELLLFGVIGLAANIAGIMVLSGRRDANFNMRAAFLEVLNDALGSVGVIVSSLVIVFTGFMQADAIAGLFIAALIVPRAAKLMRETTGVLMEFSPQGLDLEEVRRHILTVPGVHEVHDIHASTIATGLPVLTAHIVIADKCFTNGEALEILRQARTCVSEHFEVSISHSTFQLENALFGQTEPEETQHP